MKNIIDLIFYKTHLAYEKENQSGRFFSSLYLSLVILFLCTPFYGLINDLLIGYSKSFLKWIFGIYVAMIFVSVFYRYGKRGMTLALTKQFGNRTSLKKMPSWPFFLILPLAMIIGIGSYILLSIYCIKKYNLEGFLYKLFSD